jgi:hypothetical protein
MCMQARVEWMPACARSDSADCCPPLFQVFHAAQKSCAGASVCSRKSAHSIEMGSANRGQRSPAATGSQSMVALAATCERSGFEPVKQSTACWPCAV